MCLSFIIRNGFSLPAMAPFSDHRSWVLICGTPVNPLLILTNGYPHCFTPQPTFQTRSKYGPTLKAGYVVLPVITSKPLRLPYARNTTLAGFIRLDWCLPQSELCGDAGISGPTSLSFTACHWLYSGSPAGAFTLYFPAGAGLLQTLRGSACSSPSANLSLPRTLPATPVRVSLTKLHHSLLSYGLRLWPAPLARYDPCYA